MAELAFSGPPILLPRGLPPPGTPRLKEPMLRRNRFRYGLPTGLPVKVPVRSLKISVAAGGEVKSLIELVNNGGPWQLAHPCCSKSFCPATTSARFSAPAPRLAFLNGAAGVRTANCTHSFSDVNAGTAVLLPGSVTVNWFRPAFAGGGRLLIRHGARLTLPLSAKRRPWFRSNVLVAAPGGGGGLAHAWAAATGPGPETLRMFSSKSSTSSKIDE